MTPWPTFSDAGYDFLRSTEGFRAKPYWDVKGYSAGYGTFGVDPNITVTREWAEDKLRSKVKGIEDRIRQRVKVPLSQGQYDALVSYGYNLGEGYFDPGHTLIDRLNAGDYQGAADAFGMYDKAGGERNPGLSQRRARERAMFLDMAGGTGDAPQMRSEPFRTSQMGMTRAPQSGGGVLSSILGDDWSPILGALGIGILQGDDIGDGVARGMSTILPMMQENRKKAQKGQALQSLLGDANLGLSPQEMGYLTQDPELGGAVAQAYIKKRLFPDPPDDNTSSLVADLKAAGMQPGTPEWKAAILEHYRKGETAREKRQIVLVDGIPYYADTREPVIPDAPPRPDVTPYQQKRLELEAQRLELQKQGRRTRQLSVSDVDKLSKTGGELAQVAGFSKSFKDSYSGYFPLGAETRMDMARSGITNDPKTNEAASWWQEYDRYKNVVRNELFGASLTATEQDAFERADISPKMSPEIVKKNLALQESLVRKGVLRRARSLVKAGYDPAPIGEAFGVGVEEIMGQAAPVEGAAAASDYSTMSDDEIRKRLGL